MIVLAFTLVGGVWGAWSARRRRGNRLDMAQYAAAFAILGAILGVVATIAADRLLG